MFEYLKLCVSRFDFSQTRNVTQISIVNIFFFSYAGVVVVVGFAVYANEGDIEHSPYSYSGGFYLAILSAILAFVAASLFAIAKRSSGGYNTI